MTRRATSGRPYLAAAARAQFRGGRMWRRRQQTVMRAAVYAWAERTSASLRRREFFARATWRYATNLASKALHSWIMYSTDAVAGRELEQRRAATWRQGLTLVLISAQLELSCPPCNAA